MKRKQLTHTAKNLFFKYGIKRVTVEEICHEAGVSKMTFYKHYKNKHELVKEMVNEIIEESFDQYRSIMDSDLSFAEKIRKTIRMKFEGTDQMSQEFMSDYLTHAEPEMLEFVQGNTRKIYGMIIEDYEVAQKKGEIRHDIKIDFILWFLNKMPEIMGDKQLEKMYDNPRDMIMEMVNFFFYGIMPRNKE